MIPSGYFINHPALTSLVLKFNSISAVQDNAYNLVPSLTLLDMQGNSLTVITFYMFSGLINLQTLKLRMNSIHTIEAGNSQNVVWFNREAWGLVDLTS